MTVETFFADFGHLTDAPNGVQKLRELILQLAVQGKLLSQDPNDEPASILIGKVLNKNGKSLLQENEPFLLPGTWLWVKLGDISVIERGGSPRPIKDYITDDPEGLNWIKIGDTDIGGKYISSSREKIRKEGLKKTRMVYPGDFLLTNSMSFGRPYITKIEGCIHDGWLRIHPSEILDKDYLYNLLSSAYVAMFFKGAASGAVVLNLNKDKVRELPIPIPPLEEQKRIVDKVDQLMALCNELEARQQKQQRWRVRLNNAALDALLTARETNEFADHWQRISTNFDLLYDHPETIAKLRAAILQLAVQGKLVPQDPNDEPASVLLERIKVEKERLVKEKVIRKSKPTQAVSKSECKNEMHKGWGLCRLADVALTLITGPFGSSLHKSDYVQGGIPVINPASLKDERITPLPNMAINEATLERLSGFALEQDDIVMARRGEMGRCALVTENETGWLCGTGSVILRLSNEVYQPYFVKLIGSNSVREYLSGSSVGSTMSNLNQKILMNMVVSLPPKEEQKRIVAKVGQLMTMCDELEAKLNQAQQHSEKLMEATVRQLLVA